MALFAYMVTKDEANRYLRLALQSLTRVADEVLVYDDLSTDETLDILERYDVAVVSRTEGDSEFSFLRHEGRFRQQAWWYMENTFFPTIDDWVITLDADEVIHPSSKDHLLGEAEASGADAVTFPVREVFGFDDHDLTPLIRVDGFWGDIEATRMIRYRPGGVFADRTMGSGNVPGYAEKLFRTSRSEIVHYGYAQQKDREAKFDRYSGRSGHSPKHIRSIMSRGQLKPWIPLPS